MRLSREVVVVGGGLAGSAAALSLARADRAVTLLERSKAAHDKVCGEFLSHEALHYLDGLGIDVRALGAVRLGYMRLFGRTLLAEAALPFEAWSLPRRILDEALLEEAARQGVAMLRDHHVAEVQRDAGEWRLEIRGRNPFHAGHVFLASGKHDLRGRPRPAGIQPGLVGFKMHLRLSAAEQASLGNAVELMLFPGGYAGLQPTGQGKANLCLLVTAKTLRQLGGGWSSVHRHLLQTSPALAQRLSGAEALHAAPLTIASLPYGFLQRASEDGLWRVGDQAAVIPSFSGDGMSIALHSGVFAAQCYASQRSADSFQCELAAQLKHRLRLATTISQLLVKWPGMAQIARLWPALLPQIALMTRIRHKALLKPAPLARG